MKEEIQADPKAEKKAGKKKGIAGKIFQGLLIFLLVLLVIFHRPLIVAIRSVVGMGILEKGSEGLSYVPQSLSREQMLEDLDALYRNVCTESPVREQAEKYLKLDYDALYASYRSRIENCRDEYEFCALLTAFMAKLPGAHDSIKPPMDDMNRANGFPVGTELGFHGIRETNYAYWTQFEDRMWSYTQKCAVASNYGGDYVILDYDCGNGMIDEIVGGKIISLNGETMPEALKTIDTIHHLGYDARNDCLRVTQIFFNDAIGEKYDACIEMPDGSIVERDLYISPEFSLAMQFRKSIYPDHDAASKEGDESASETTQKKGYSIETDPERKLIYIEAKSCNYADTEPVAEELAQAIESIDAENIIIDLKNNGGGDSTFVTEGLCKAVLEGEGGWMSTAVYPRTEVTALFCDNPLYSLEAEFRKQKDSFVCVSDERVAGEAKKHLNIYVLVSGRTFSSGDICAGILAKVEGITLIGENTKGEGFTGSPLVYFLPNSRIAYSFTCSVSEECPENNYLGTVPDIYCPDRWEDWLKQEELFDEGISSEALGTYEYRLLWDQTLIEAIRIIDGGK
ncbi:MAG: hypothetical protein K6E50_04580 [Lachnospiraceae bacterium]|nr:hypothetical protein [Lachnospiraceae bacterium]